MAVVPDEEEQGEGEGGEHELLVDLDGEERVDEAEGDEQGGHGPGEAGAPEQGDAHGDHASADEEGRKQAGRDDELAVLELVEVDLP